MAYYYNDSFLIKAKRTVYKWWCVVYKPVYRLVHHGYWPAEKEPYAKYPVNNPDYEQSVEKMAEQLSSESDNDFDNSMSATVDVHNENTTESHSVSTDLTDTPNETSEPEIDLSAVDDNVLDRANEIMARLAREAAEDEAKKQAEIDEAKKKAEENEKLAMIMQANKVDISSFIEEGRAHQSDNNFTIN